jgi:ADP-ribosylglycohydrolase
MSVSVLNEADYYRIVYGGWLGKNIGGTLGAPVEGRKELLELSFYPVLPEGPLENDDLDLQLVWLHALEQYGPRITAKELGQEWLEHVFFPFDEYGYALTNLRRGLIAPVAGAFNNPFTNGMGSPIRSEIWAMTAPGAPEVAAYYAYQDAIVDHAGGEGVYGEMFFAALESAVFFEKDRDRLIEIGMQYIPEDSRTAAALKDLLVWHQEGQSWTEARELILEKHGSDNFTDAPQNIAFTILGWLYGDNFEDAILKAVNCGYDTDCTAATLGAILGMLHGPEGLPDKWVSPVGDKVVVSPPIKGFPAPKNLDELTARTIRAGKQVLAAWNTDIIVHPELSTSLDRPSSNLSHISELWDRKVTVNQYLLPEGTWNNPDMELLLDYGTEGPAIGSDQSRVVRVSLNNHSNVFIEGTLSLEVPEGWTGPAVWNVLLQPGESDQRELTVMAGRVHPVNRLIVSFRRTHDHSLWSEQRIPFTMVGASPWRLSSSLDDEVQLVYVAGDRISWTKVSGHEESTIYRAESILHNPISRTVRLIAAANGPVQVKLDGQLIIQSRHTLEFMPAYHRAHAEQYVELDLKAGYSKIEIEMLSTDPKRQPEVYILPVATRATSSPGAFYYYTDMEWVT